MKLMVIFKCNSSDLVGTNSPDWTVTQLFWRQRMLRLELTSFQLKSVSHQLMFLLAFGRSAICPDECSVERLYIGHTASNVPSEYFQ